MGVMIKTPLILQSFVNVAEIEEVSGTSVRDCLNDLTLKYPKIREFLFDGNEVLRASVVINGKALRQNDLDTKVSDKDDFSLLMPISGG